MKTKLCIDFGNNQEHLPLICWLVLNWWPGFRDRFSFLETDIIQKKIAARRDMVSPKFCKIYLAKPDAVQIIWALKIWSTCGDKMRLEGGPLYAHLAPPLLVSSVQCSSAFCTTYTTADRAQNDDHDRMRMSEHDLTSYNRPFRRRDTRSVVRWTRYATPAETEPKLRQQQPV